MATTERNELWGGETRKAVDKMLKSDQKTTILRSGILFSGVGVSIGGSARCAAAYL